MKLIKHEALVKTIVTQEESYDLLGLTRDQAIGLRAVMCTVVGSIYEPAPRGLGLEAVREALVDHGITFEAARNAVINLDLKVNSTTLNTK